MRINKPFFLLAMLFAASTQAASTPEGWNAKIETLTTLLRDVRDLHPDFMSKKIAFIRNSLGDQDEAESHWRVVRSIHADLVLETALLKEHIGTQFARMSGEDAAKALRRLNRDIKKFQHIKEFMSDPKAAEKTFAQLAQSHGDDPVNKKRKFSGDGPSQS